MNEQEVRYILLPAQGMEVRADELRFKCQLCPATVNGVGLADHTIQAHGKTISTITPAESLRNRGPDRSRFREELETLINTHSMENWSNTPDFLLAEFLGNVLTCFDMIVERRDEWYLNGQHLEPAMVPAERAVWLSKIMRGDIPETGTEKGKEGG